MKKLLLALAMFVFVGCAAQQTYPKFPLNNPGEEIQAIISYVFEQENLSQGPWQNWRAILVNEPFIFYKRVEGTDQAEVVILIGMTVLPEQVILVYHYQPCLAASSLIHELYHALGYNHAKHPDIWDNRVQDVTEEATRIFCGEDYVPLEMPEPTMEQIQKALPLPSEDWLDY